LFNPTDSSNTVTLTAVNGGYTLSALGFGAFYPSGSSGTQYYENIDFQGVSTNAYISPSILGIGLPDYLWNQIVNLLYQANNIDLNTLGMECNEYNNNIDGGAVC